MDWTAIGALGELVGAAAVVISSTWAGSSSTPARSRGPKDFAPREAARVGYLYHALLSLTHTLYERRAEGLITADELDRWAAKNRGLMGSSYLCEPWPRLKPNFPPDYAAWLKGRYNLPRDPAGGA
ncbi:MAG: hypothetical protein Q8P50_02110 [Bacillota bacterium]|nr:hypothetical protein [Bacillota bacterium]